MNYEQAYRFIIPKLEDELPVYYTYHNVSHTKEVLQVAGRICDAEKVTEFEKDLVLTAVLYHDSGLLKSYHHHEDQSCEIAREALPAFEYTPDNIEQICELILSTRLPQKPLNTLQKIICDADLHYLGTSHYFATADKLFHELKHLNLIRDREEWHKNQITFLGEHAYSTRAAIKEFQSLKKQNLQLLTAKRNPPKEHVNKTASIINDWILIILGALSASFGLESFLVPNGFLDGGVSGIALLLQRIYDLDLSMLIILLNLPIIAVYYFKGSKSFSLKTFVAIILLGIFLHYIHYQVATHDKLLVSVFGGFFIGLGSGLAIRGGCALDGTEILAMYTIKKTSFTISEIILAINILIFSVAAFKFGVEVALYSILTYVAASQTIGYVIEGIEAYTGVTIISEHSEMIKRRLVNEMGRGITVYKGERGFLPGNFEVSNDCDIIFTVITRLELRKLKNLVYQTDGKAFVFANTIKEASGGVIKRKDSH